MLTSGRATIDVNKVATSESDRMVNRPGWQRQGSATRNNMGQVGLREGQSPGGTGLAGSSGSPGTSMGCAGQTTLLLSSSCWLHPGPHAVLPALFCMTLKEPAMSWILLYVPAAHVGGHVPAFSLALQSVQQSPGSPPKKLRASEPLIAAGEDATQATATAIAGPTPVIRLSRKLARRTGIVTPSTELSHSCE